MMLSGSSVLRRRSTGSWILLCVVLVVFSAWTIFPVFWALVTSFKFTGDAYDPTVIPWVQFKPTLQGWRFVFITAAERTFR
jgi:multiple sugar transport system permease protein